VVVGHPKDNAPAYGWVESLKRDGEVLWAKLKDIVPEFREWLDKKLYKKRSISLYPDGSLRHVGFLGAVPPAVKGLPDPAFRNDGGADVTEIDLDFAEGGVRLHRAGYENAMRLIRGGKVGLESAWSISAEGENALLGDPPDWGAYSKWFLGVDDSASAETKAHYKYPFGKGGKVYRSALTAVRQRAGQQGARDIFDAAGRLLEALDKEEKNMGEVEQLRAELDKIKSEKEAAERERLEMADRLKRQEIQAYCEKLEHENKIPPVFRERGLIEFLMALEGQTTEIAFAEGKQTASAWFRKFLEQLPESVPLGAQFIRGEPAVTDDEERNLGLRIAGVKLQK
jgi:hypothetical protein